MLAVTNSDHGELKINNNETPTSDSASRICDVCGKQFDSKDKLKSHRKTHVKVQCTLCPKMVIAKHMPRHLRTVHKTDTTPASDTAIPAPVPPDTFPASPAPAPAPSEEVVSLAADTTPASHAASLASTAAIPNEAAAAAPPAPDLVGHTTPATSQPELVSHLGYSHTAPDLTGAAAAAAPPSPDLTGSGGPVPGYGGGV